MNNDDKLKKHYNNLCKIKSDINEHLPTLKKFSSCVDHVTEFGFRTGRSTTGLLMGYPKILKSYDITGCKDYVEQIQSIIPKEIKFEFICANTLKIEIEPTDLLFIDTLHTEDQLSQELKLHSVNVKKYIILHDTVSFGLVGEDPNKRGLNFAIMDFLKNNKSWRKKEEYKNNNGLIILERSNVNE